MLVVICHLLDRWSALTPDTLAGKTLFGLWGSFRQVRPAKLFKYLAVVALIVMGTDALAFGIEAALHTRKYVGVYFDESAFSSFLIYGVAQQSLAGLLTYGGWILVVLLCAVTVGYLQR